MKINVGEDIELNGVLYEATDSGLKKKIDRHGLFIKVGGVIQPAFHSREAEEFCLRVALGEIKVKNIDAVAEWSVSGFDRVVYEVIKKTDDTYILSQVQTSKGQDPIEPHLYQLLLANMQGVLKFEYPERLVPEEVVGRNMVNENGIFLSNITRSDGSGLRGTALDGNVYNMAKEIRVMVL